VSGSPRKSNVETKFALEALSPIDLRRRSVGTSHLAVPWSARLSADGVLSWNWQSPSRLTSRGPSGTTSRQPGKVASLLWRKFAALSFGSDEDIRKFAERWGPLRGGPTETIAEWRRLANLASALVRSSVALANGDLGENGDWGIIGDWLGYDCEPYLHLPDRISDARSRDLAPFLRRVLIGQALNGWFAESKGNSLLRLVKDELVIEPSSNTLLGILVLQLAYRITRAQEMVVCFHCKALFSPVRAPSHGTRQFCAKCRRKGKPQMYAARDYRRRRT